MIKVIVLCLTFLFPIASTSEVKDGDVENLLSVEQSRLIEAGDCNASDFGPSGGWKKSTVDPRPKVFYVHCKVKGKITTYYFSVKKNNN